MSTNDTTDYANKERKHQASNASIEELVLMQWIPVVCQPNGYDSANRKQET
ncbi:MAG: hypothetical protein IIW69_04180 [Bacteroidaceae bacterium]|nr:hypothetical protein [Bacteroidaceae bacterium]